MKRFPTALGRYTTRYAISRKLLLRFDVIRRMSSSAATLDITASPAVGQNLFHEGKEYTTIREGLAHILIPATDSKTPQTVPKGDNEAQSVFYNPIQQFNRDLSVLAIKAYGEQTLVKKTKNLEAIRQRTNAKRKDKKRKREEDGLSGDVSRKAGKLDDSDRKTPSVNDQGNNADEVLQEQIPGLNNGNVEHFEAKIDAHAKVEPPRVEPNATLSDRHEVSEAQNTQSKPKPSPSFYHP